MLAGSENTQQSFGYSCVLVVILCLKNTIFSIAIVEETEEDKANKRLRTLESLFPDTDPEFLHQKAVEIGDNEEEMNRWIGEAIENKSAKEFPSRSDYEERRKNAEMQEKYSGQVTVQEILDMYDDPDAYFMDEKVS